MAALELLQWQDNIERPLELVAPIQATLGALLSWQGAGGGAAGGYAAQLALAALLGLAKRAQQAQQAMEQFDLGLAVRAAQAAPSGALRNAALSLVGVLAAAAPQQALGHVLQVVGVVGPSGAKQADAHSNKVSEWDVAVRDFSPPCQHIRIVVWVAEHYLCGVLPMKLHDPKRSSLLY